MDKMTGDTGVNMSRMGSQLYKDAYKALKSELKDVKSIRRCEANKRTVVSFKRFVTFFFYCYFKFVVQLVGLRVKTWADETEKSITQKFKKKSSLCLTQKKKHILI